MLVAVYENQKYSTFLAPLEKKGEIENFFKEIKSLFHLIVNETKKS